MSRKGLTWTEVEDELLSITVRNLQISSGKPFHHAHKVNWNTVAEKIPGRTAAGCQSRWNVTLDPTVDRSPWTSSLDEELLRLFKDKTCPSWSKRAAILSRGKVYLEIRSTSQEIAWPMRRSGADCCDRYFYLKKNLPSSCDSKELSNFEEIGEEKRRLRPTETVDSLETSTITDEATSSDCRPKRFRKL